MDYNEFDQAYVNASKLLNDPTYNENGNEEPIEQGDKIKIVDLNDKIVARNITRTIEKENGEKTQETNKARWLTFKCSGDRGSVSLGTLQSTAKLNKHFGDWAKENNIDLFDGKTMALPRNRKDAAIEVLENWKGKEIEAAHCHTFTNRFGQEQTYVLWREAE